MHNDLVNLTDDDTTTELSKFKSAVSSEVEGAIHFRSERAELYPEDERNQQSADCLTTLSKNLALVSDDDPTLLRCFTAYKWKHQQAGNCDAGFAWLDESFLWVPSDIAEGVGQINEHKQIFLRYGFDEPEDGNATDFLSRFAKEITYWNLDDLRG